MGTLFVCKQLKNIMKKNKIRFISVGVFTENEL